MNAFKNGDVWERCDTLTANRLREYGFKIEPWQFAAAENERIAQTERGKRVINREIVERNARQFFENHQNRGEVK